MSHVFFSPLSFFILLFFFSQRLVMGFLGCSGPPQFSFLVDTWFRTAFMNYYYFLSLLGMTGKLEFFDLTMGFCDSCWLLGAAPGLWFLLCFALVGCIFWDQTFELFFCWKKCSIRFHPLWPSLNPFSMTNVRKGYTFDGQKFSGIWIAEPDFLWGSFYSLTLVYGHFLSLPFFFFFSLFTFYGDVQTIHFSDVVDSKTSLGHTETLAVGEEEIQHPDGFLSRGTTTCGWEQRKLWRVRSFHHGIWIADAQLLG